MKMAEKKDGMEYCIVRTESAGVFAGYIKDRHNNEVVLVDAIRIWYWEGAASLSQMAVEGVKTPENCKFAVPVPEVILFGVVEIIKVTADAKACIEGVPSWRV